MNRVEKCTFKWTDGIVAVFATVIVNKKFAELSNAGQLIRELSVPEAHPQRNKFFLL